MVKAISSSLVRKFATTALATLAVTGVYAHNLKQESVNNENNQTEVVSKETAQALQANFVAFQQTPIIRNAKLDNLYLKDCKSTEDFNATKASLNKFYEALGTYGATAELQKGIDNQYIERTFNKYLSESNLTQKEREEAEAVISNFYGWKDNIYTKAILDEEAMFYSSDRLPEEYELNDLYNSRARKNAYFNEALSITYFELLEGFIDKLPSLLSRDTASNILAYQVHIFNSLAYLNYFNENPMPKMDKFVNIFFDDFMHGEACIKP